jgi:hypothetical protein
MTFTGGLVLSVPALKDSVGAKGYSKILKALTVTQKLSQRESKYGFPISIRAYKLCGGSLIIPRVKAGAVKRTGAGSGEYHLHASEPIDMDLGETTFYDYQQAAIDYITDTVLEEQNGCAYLHLSTGLGKTRAAIGIIAVLSVKTVVVVPAKSLQSQWLKELSTLSPGTNAIAYGNPLGELVDCDVAVCVVNTFRGKDLAFLRDNGFGLVIFDEAHEYYTKMNSNALWLAQGAEFVLGLSATPLERKDGLDTFVTHFLGKPIMQDTIPGFDMEQGAFPGEVTRIRYSCDIQYADTKLTSRGTPCNASTLSLVLSDPDRLTLVASETLRLFREEHGIFVFSEFREYLIQLRDRLAELGLEESDIAIEDDGSDSDRGHAGGDRDEGDSGRAGGDSGHAGGDRDGGDSGRAGGDSGPASSIPLAVLRGGVRSDYLESVRKKGARVVLTTYGYSRRGVSLPRMTAIVLASPRRNGLMQILGRVTRKGDDMSIVRQIVDIVDVNTMYRGQFYDRKTAYALRDWPVKSRDV